MRQRRRFVPSFDNLSLRITPSGGAVAAGVTPDSDMIPIPGEGVPMNPSDWIIPLDYPQRPLSTETCIQDLHTAFDSMDGHGG